RQVELFTEWGSRWFDLKRTGAVDAVLGAVKMNWQPYKALFPVPRTQLQFNNQLVQNAGY
ncbi:MAG: RagB/SusD family nutrient uptake outer membrane protein, partial [Bacteroidetes bacterium]|nr:RagB/SusD family nutrient uptake outer membrane protein [Bacteroidota bacterium]